MRSISLRALSVAELLAGRSYAVGQTAAAYTAELERRGVVFPHRLVREVA